MKSSTFTNVRAAVWWARALEKMLSCCQLNYVCHICLFRFYFGAAEKFHKIVINIESLSTPPAAAKPPLELFLRFSIASPTRPKLGKLLEDTEAIRARADDAKKQGSW